MLSTFFANPRVQQVVLEKVESSKYVKHWDTYDFPGLRDWDAVKNKSNEMLNATNHSTRKDYLDAFKRIGFATTSTSNICLPPDQSRRRDEMGESAAADEIRQQQEAATFLKIAFSHYTPGQKQTSTL